MPESETQSGGCHCGAVRFTATGDFSSVMECNCSHCSKKGFLLAFMPRADFTLTEGADKVSEYRFNRHVIAHMFCQVCGVQPYGLGKGPDGSEMAAINVRCVDDVDLGALKRTPYDGASM
jgi:hypothetical protein